MTLRRAIAVVLCLLLLSLQQEMLVHPVSHWGAPAKATGAASTQASSDCVECALLASGFNAAASAQPTTAADVPAAGLVFHSHRSRDADAPAWFRSRAPPVLL